MADMMQTTSLWAHLLCMVGAFGTLVAIQLVIPGPVREDKDVARRSFTLLNALLAIGLVAGLAAYYFKIRSAGVIGEDLPGTVHMKVGIKFILLLVTGACLGIGSAKAKKGHIRGVDGLRWASLLLLASAAFLGVYL